VLDDQVISAPRINEHIPGGTGIITGNFSVEESTELAVLLRAGALPAAMEFLEERTIGPELGADSVAAGKTAAIIGLIVVAGYMIASYGMFGVFANIALAVNVLLMVAILSSDRRHADAAGHRRDRADHGHGGRCQRADLRTHPRGIAQPAMNPARAIEAGFDRAFSAIIDSNVTGLLTALIMFFIGSGPVRGFAVTMSIGILTSMFTAVYVTRTVVELWLNRRRPKAIVV
jgi:preprotein translocase subunit SecD